MFCTKTSLAVSRWIGRRSNECQDICRCLENPELVAGGFLQLFHLGRCRPRTRRCKDSDLQSINIYIYISTICLRNISRVACARWVAATYMSWNYHVAPISHVGGLGKMCFQHFRSHRDTFWQRVISGCASGTWFHQIFWGWLTCRWFFLKRHRKQEVCLKLNTRGNTSWNEIF